MALRLAVLALLTLLAGPVAAGIPADLDAAVDPYLRRGDFMGVVGFQASGEPATLQARGLASVELNVPHSRDGIFAIGSLSKQFTAAAILLLWEDGRLALTDSAHDHLPELAGSDPVTVHQLLTHTAGIVDVYSLPSFGATRGTHGDADAVVAEICAAARTHAPGTEFAYSNGGYVLLAEIVARVSGMPYGQFLEERIFRPLGMESTAHEAEGPARPGRVRGYDPWGVSSLSPARTISPAFTRGGGSLWSSATDLLAWTHALHGGDVLSPESYEAFTADHGHGYGYGVSVFRRFGRDAIGHDGRIDGFATDLAWYREDRVAVVVLSNVQSVGRDEIRRGVAAVALGEPLPDVEARALRPSTAAERRGLDGVYNFFPGFDVTITVVGGRVLARANEGGDSELVPSGDDTWFSRSLYATVRFARDDDGNVDRILWGAGEGAPVGRRIL